MIQLAPTDYATIGLSVKIAFTALAISLPPGFAVASLSTFTRFRGKSLQEAIVNLSLTLPPVLIGYLLLLSFGRNGWLGPLLVRTIRIGMESICIVSISISVVILLLHERLNGTVQEGA